MAYYIYCSNNNIGIFGFYICKLMPNTYKFENILSHNANSQSIQDNSSEISSNSDAISNK